MEAKNAKNAEPVLPRIPAQFSTLVSAVVKAGQNYGKARSALGAALFTLRQSGAAEALGMEFEAMAMAVARESGFDLSRSTIHNAIRIGTVRNAAPEAVKGMGDTVVLRMAEALGGRADDADAVAAFAAEVKAEGGTVESVKAVRAGRDGGAAAVDPRAAAVTRCAEVLGKAFKGDAAGQTRALSEIARSLGLNGLADMISMGRDGIEGAIRKRMEADRAARVAAASANMAKADAAAAFAAEVAKSAEPVRAKAKRRAG